MCLGAALEGSPTKEASHATKKHVSSSKPTTISIGDSGPVDPLPPGRKHGGSAADSIDLSGINAELPSSPTSKKLVPGGGATTLSLKDNNDPVQSGRPSRKQVASSGEAFSVFRSDTGGQAQKPSKKISGGNTSSIDLSDKVVDVHQKSARRQYQPNASDLVLADEAPLMAAPHSRKHSSSGQSSIKFGEGVIEEVNTGRRKVRTAGETNGMHDVMTRPTEDVAGDSTSAAPPASPNKDKATASPVKQKAITPSKPKPIPSTRRSPVKAKASQSSASTELVMEDKKAAAPAAPEVKKESIGETREAPLQRTTRPGVRNQQAPGGTSSLVLG